MTEYTVKYKRVDTGKYWIAGNVKPGKFGLQAGLKKTPELKAYLDSIPDGGWINFSLDAPYDAAKKKVGSAVDKDLNDEIPW